MKKKLLQNTKKSKLLSVLIICISFFLIFLFSIFFGNRISGEYNYSTALGEVEIEVKPAWRGHINTYIPLADWGIEASAFKGPIELYIEPHSLDREALLDAAAGDSEVLSQAETDLKAGVTNALWSNFVIILIVTTLFSFFVMKGLGFNWYKTTPFFLLSSALIMLFFLWSMQTTFDAKSLSKPTFYARGAELNQILDMIENQSEENGYSTSFAKALSSFSNLLTGNNTAPESKNTMILASDIHNNTFTLDPFLKFSANNPVFLAGDYGMDGNESEADLIAKEINDSSKRTIAISGNHDSQILMQKLEDAGVEVLDNDTTRVNNMLVAGYDDPLKWNGEDPSNPQRIFSFREYDNEEELTQLAERDLWQWFQEMVEKNIIPNIIIVHQNGLAQNLASRLQKEGWNKPLTIMTGHDHLQHVDQYGDVVVVDAGSLGAGGILAVGEEYAGIAQLHFDKKVLKAVDFIRIEPVSGNSEAQRIVLEECNNCSYTEDGLEKRN